MAPVWVFSQGMCKLVLPPRACTPSALSGTPGRVISLLLQHLCFIQELPKLQAPFHTDLPNRSAKFYAGVKAGRKKFEQCASLPENPD